jgi:hypothetical protein
VRGFLSASHKPLLQNNDLGSERRPDFALEEYRSLIRSLPSWIEQAQDRKSREMRLLLRDYVCILANTGIREGTEAERILGVSNEQLAHCRSTDVVLGEFREFLAGAKNNCSHATEEQYLLQH